MTKLKEIVKKPTTAVIAVLGVAVIALIAVVIGLFGKDAVLDRNAIGKEEALSSALADAGYVKEEATVSYTKYEFEDGEYVYEVEFVADGVEYEYLVRASDGAIVKKESEPVRVAATQQATVPTTETANPTEAQTDSQGSTQTGGTQSATQAGGNSTVSSTRPSKPVTTTAAVSTTYVGVDKAKSIALAHAGFAASDVKFLKAKLENDDGRIVYDVEFIKGLKEYDYTIEAATGRILEFDSEYEDFD